MSGGQRQRVSLMRALMLDPPLLLLDEPLGALDPVIRSDLQADLRTVFQALHKTVVLVTHDLGEAGFLGDLLLLMQEGRIVQQDTFVDLIEKPADAFVTRFINAQRHPLGLAGGAADESVAARRGLRSLFAALLATGCQRSSADAGEPVVRVGSKAFVEGVILGEIVADLAENAGAGWNTAAGSATPARRGTPCSAARSTCTANTREPCRRKSCPANTCATTRPSRKRWPSAACA